MVFCQICGTKIKHKIKNDFNNRKMHKKCWKSLDSIICYDYKTGELLRGNELSKANPIDYSEIIQN